MVNRKGFIILITSIFITGVLFRVMFLWTQPPLGDDTLFVISAENYMERGQVGPSMIHHPNLRNILIYVSTRFFGNGPLGVYGPSLLSGILCIILVYLLALEFLKDRAASAIAMFFIAIDPLHISFSRQAIQETTTAFFILLAVYLYFMFLKKERLLFLTLSGIAFGLGTASKWQALFPLMYCIVHLIVTRKRGALGLLSHLTLLPFTVYLLTFIPWFTRGYDLIEWFHYQKQLYYLNTIHVNPVEEAIRNPGKPLLWFIIPAGYGIFTYSAGVPYVTVSMGNPLIWLLALPCLIFIISRHKIMEYLHPGGLFLVSYIPMVLASINRDIYVLSAVSVTPFAFIIIAGVINTLRKRFRYIVYPYLGIVLVVSILMYPMAIGRALEYPYLKPVVERYNPHER